MVDPWSAGPAMPPDHQSAGDHGTATPKYPPSVPGHETLRGEGHIEALKDPDGAGEDQEDSNSQTHCGVTLKLACGSSLDTECDGGDDSCPDENEFCSHAS